MTQHTPKAISAPLEKLVPYEHNVKEHTPEQVEKIANSIARFGMVQPIVVDEDFVVVIGHGRLMALQKLGYTEVPKGQLFQVSTWSADEKRALRIADNKLNMDTGFNVDNLAFELEQLVAGGAIELKDFSLDFDLDALMGVKNAKREEDVDTTSTSKLDSYLNNTVKQIVLLFPNDEYEMVLGKLMEIMKAQKLENNTDVFMFLLRQYENANPGSPA